MKKKREKKNLYWIVYTCVIPFLIKSKTDGDVEEQPIPRARAFENQDSIIHCDNILKLQTLFLIFIKS